MTPGIFLSHGTYWIIIALMMLGLFITFASENLIKRLVGLSLFQTSVCLFYIALAKVDGGTAPILFGADAKAPAPHLPEDGMLTAPAAGAAELVHTYSNPLPHVLILTAIVVGVATLSVGLALIVRIREAYGSIEYDDISATDRETALAEAGADGAAKGGA